MELRHLRYVLAVAEELNFTRAARRLGLAQPPLSRQIRELEEEVGIQLFERTKRSVWITPAGQLFAEEARQILIHAEQAIAAARRASRGEAGLLNIGYSGALVGESFPRLLRSFRESRPGITVRIHELSPADQIDALLAARIDAAFPGVRFFARKELTFENFQRSRVCAVMTLDHPLAKRRRVPLRLLATEPLVVLTRRVAPGYFDWVTSLCRKAGYTPNMAYESDRSITILELAAAGFGVGILPDTMQKYHGGEVVFRPLIGIPEAQHCVAWLTGNRSAALQAFIAIMRRLRDERKPHPPTRRS